MLLNCSLLWFHFEEKTLKINEGINIKWSNKVPGVFRDFRAISAENKNG